jgi:hypothetical protein
VSRVAATGDAGGASIVDGAARCDRVTSR